MNHRVLACVLAAVAVAACGGDDDSAGTGGATGSGGATGGSGGSTGGTGGTGGSSTGGSAGTGGSTGSTGGTGGTGGSSTCGPTCGTAPYQCYDPMAALIVYGNPQTPTTVTANICPSTSVQVPYQGQSALQVQRNTPFFFIGTQTGSLDAFSIEFNVKVSAFSKLPSLLSVFPPTHPATVDPAWSSTTKALINVLINATAGGATAPCNDKSGVTFTVKDHAEAVVKYPNNGTSTSGGGDAKASITIVTSGTATNPEYVTVIATKGSCKLGLNASDQLFITGRTPVAINTVTSGVGFEISN